MNLLLNLLANPLVTLHNSTVTVDRTTQPATMRVLAIETSCDETSAAVLSGSEAQPLIESHIVLSQEAASRPYGGVVPELVARAHLKTLDSVIARALKASKHSLGEIDLIAATCGPGLLGGLIIGSLMAKTLALARGIPFMAINHLEGHALSPRLSSLTALTSHPASHLDDKLSTPYPTSHPTPHPTPHLDFPYLLLLVSGGHCQLLDIESVSHYRLLGQTLDDSVGECLDKGARLLGLRECNGAALERAAARGDAARFARDFTTLPIPMRATANCDFSFSGLKSALARTLQGRVLDDQQRFDAAAALQESVISSLCDRSERAFELTAARNQKQNKREPYSCFAVAGGVSANRQLCARLDSLASRLGFSFFNPRPELCTDNAAMIGYAALARASCHTNSRTTTEATTETLRESLQESLRESLRNSQSSSPDDIDFFVRPRWPLDAKARDAKTKNTKARHTRAADKAYVRLPKTRVDAYEAYG